MKKDRKPRGIKKDGSRSLNLCSGCGYFLCDPIFNNDGPANTKIQKRLRNGLCMGCGKTKDKCSCKSKNGLTYKKKNNDTKN